MSGGSFPSIPVHSRLIFPAILLLLPAAASAQRINLPTVTRVTWPNGIRVVLMEYHRAPTITVTAAFPGGASEDPAGKSGLAALTADLLRHGTEKRTADQISEQVDFLGASLDGAAGDDRVTVSLGALAKDTDTGLDLFADVVRHPTFPVDEIERERQLEIAGLQALGEDPGAVARRVAREVVFAGHPYGAQPTITSVKGISRQDIQGCYRRYFVPNRMILVAVGDFKTPEMLARLKSRFADWEKGAAPVIDVPRVKPTPRRQVIIDKPDATQTQVRYNRVAFSRGSPDYFAALVADAALGGGFTSRLVDEIRVNRSLTYSIGSGFGPERFGGSFTVSTFTKIETTRKLLDAVRIVLQKTATGGFTDAEVTKFKRYLMGDFAISVQTPEALAGQLADIAFFNLPPNYLQTYLGHIRTVTKADVNRIARTYFSPGRLNIVLVAPARTVGPQLTGLGSWERRSVEAVGK